MRTSRREFHRLFAAGLLGSGGVLAAPRRPNIVMIYADDLGYGDLGCYGNPTIRTPNLDRMAAEGTRFTQWYSAAPVCTPSRAALLTGRYPVRSGMTRVLFPNSPGGIPESETTIAQVLKGAGYRTAAIGKWHLGCLPRYMPLRHGFDSYFGLPYSNDMTPTPGPGSSGAPQYPPLPLYKDDKVVETGPDQSTLTQRYTAEAVKSIQAAGANPFFLYFAHTFPHVPLYASARFRGKSPRGLYGDAVEELDWSAGEVLKAISAAGHDRNTLVVFSSDNGPWLPRKQYGGSAGLLKEGKGTTWEGGMREPCIARWPGTVPAAVSTAPCCMLDLFPTFASLAGAKPPEGDVLDGEDIGPVLRGQSPGHDRAFFYWNAEELRAIRMGPWKLHVVTNTTETQPATVMKLDTPALYQVEHDPSEKLDVAAGHPDIVQKLLNVMEAHKAQIQHGPLQR